MTSNVLIDLEEELGAESQIGSQRVAIYIPNRDRNELEIKDIDAWVSAAMEVFVTINGGVTKLATASGIWHDTDNNKRVYEDSTIVYSNIMNAKVFADNLDKLKKFLHKFGRETNQGEVMVEFMGETDDEFQFKIYSIKKYVN